jgi:predicted amidohydrolase
MKELGPGMRIALIQVASPEAEAVDHRRERVEDLVRSAKGADLIVLPELWPVGYFAFDRYADHAETLEGKTVSRLAAAAQDMQCLIHVGSFVEQAQGGVRNTAVLLGPAGDVLHAYSKIHVFGYESREAELLQPGKLLGLSDSRYGRFASTTCYDLRFPELWRALIDAGAELVVVPAAWPAARLSHWRLFTSARAVEQQVYVIACNAVGEQSGIALGGHSRVVDPWGAVVAEAGTEEGILWCDIDPARVEATRGEFPVLRDRLPDYDVLANGGTA